MKIRRVKKTIKNQKKTKYKKETLTGGARISVRENLKYCYYTNDFQHGFRHTRATLAPNGIQEQHANSNFPKPYNRVLTRGGSSGTKTSLKGINRLTRPAKNKL